MKKKFIVFMLLIITMTLAITTVTALAEEPIIDEEPVIEQQTIEQEIEDPLSTADRVREFFKITSVSDVLNWVISLVMTFIFKMIIDSVRSNKTLSVNLEKGTVGLKEALVGTMKLEGRIASMEEWQKKQDRIQSVIIEKLDSQSDAFIAVYGAMINNEDLRNVVITLLTNGRHALTEGKHKKVIEKLNAVINKSEIAKEEAVKVSDEIMEILGG